MKLYNTSSGAVVEENGQFFALPHIAWDKLLNLDNLQATIRHQITNLNIRPVAQTPKDLLPPIGTQEVWAAGVTYHRSRDARMEESQKSGADDFYAKVYEADRPELFFKSTPHRVVGPGQKVRIRQDSKWNVPEPELTLAINARGQIIGYTVGNDMSSRDIEGENPLYLPQAKVYDGCCALGPAILLSSDPLPAETEIKIKIERAGAEVFAGTTTLARMKRTPTELVGWLFRDNSFPVGCLMMTGTGIVPPSTFTLDHGDVVTIEIPPIGVLRNVVA